MADIIDQAQDQNPDALSTRQREPEGPPWTGYCHYCDERVSHPRRFCDFNCADDWETERKAEQRNRSAE